MGLFSTQIRCLDQRMNILDNSSILQMRNHTKLRSGSLVTFVISHRQTDLDIVYETLALEIEAFALDTVWGNRLLGDPILRGVKRTTALGVQMQVLLVTRAGEQWTTERDFNAVLYGRCIAEGFSWLMDWTWAACSRQWREAADPMACMESV